VFGPPKTRSSVRTVPVGDTVIDALAAHLAAHPAEPSDLIFRTTRGTPLTRTVFGRAWTPAAKAMGLEPGEGLHQLRHFYASLLIADGRSVKEVQERLGHASAQETLDTYSHLFPGSDDGTRTAIDRAFAPNAESGAAPKDDAANDE
jgi:integrase